MSGYLRFIKTWNVVKGLCLLSSHRSCHEKVYQKKKEYSQTAQFCQVVTEARVHQVVVLPTPQPDGEEMTGTGGRGSVP